MIYSGLELFGALLILGFKAFAMLLMILGAIDLHGHLQERKRAK